jgi:hypothetical protein
MAQSNATPQAAGREPGRYELHSCASVRFTRWFHREGEDYRLGANMVSLDEIAAALNDRDALAARLAQAEADLAELRSAARDAGNRWYTTDDPFCDMPFYIDRLDTLAKLNPPPAEQRAPDAPVAACLDSHGQAGYVTQADLDALDPVDTAPPDAPEPSEPCGHCRVCLEGVNLPGTNFPVLGSQMICCPNCGNKRCPKATDHRLDCTGSNEPGQPGSYYGTNTACNGKGRV